VGNAPARSVVACWMKMPEEDATAPVARFMSLPQKYGYRLGGEKTEKNRAEFCKIVDNVFLPII